MNKLERLETILSQMGSCLLAYSGGVDSSFLLAAATDALGSRCLAVTVCSLFHEREEGEDARRRAARIGARHRLIDLDLSVQEKALVNPPDRCYYCKRAIFSSLRGMAAQEDLAVLIEASHADDLGERRPGIKALEELGVRSPLLEAGFTKNEIRECSRELGLEGADRFSAPCLATRIPYGTTITRPLLERVAGAEKVLRDLGFSSPRVRDYDRIARIEVRGEDLARVADPDVRAGIVGPLRKLGYVYITLDLGGYRSGSMDEVLG